MPCWTCNIYGVKLTSFLASRWAVVLFLKSNTTLDWNSMRRGTVYPVHCCILSRLRPWHVFSNEWAKSCFGNLPSQFLLLLPANSLMFHLKLSGSRKARLCASADQVLSLYFLAFLWNYSLSWKCRGTNNFDIVIYSLCPSSAIWLCILQNVDFWGIRIPIWIKVNKNVRPLWLI